MSKQKITLNSLFERDDVKARFEEMIGNRAKSFMVSVLQIANSSHQLKNADPMSIYQGAILAATLDLPLNNNLGFAYLVPYRGKAQFQIGYKGFIQLALRTSLFKNISASEIRAGQIVSKNPLTGFEFDFNVEGGEIIGYASYMKLVNGFEKVFYMPKENVLRHAERYSQSYRNGSGVWKDNFQEMAMKTVLKLLLSTYAPLSIEMKKAIYFDQSVIEDADSEVVEYVDNKAMSIEEIQNEQEKERLKDFINTASTQKQLASVADGLDLELKTFYDEREKVLIEMEAKKSKELKKEKELEKNPKSKKA